MSPQTPLISVNGTVYNNKSTVEKSLESVAKALETVDYEIVVVDNFSTDGTYETLIKLSKKYPLRVYRYRCSRGLGRHVAALFSRGKYLVYVDLDCIYSNQLSKLVLGYLQSRFRDSKCFGLLICPKRILEDFTYRDLNRAEDVDLGTRLSMNNLVIALPLKYDLRNEIRGATDFNQNLLNSFIPTISSEIRYSRGAINYIRREIRNKLDFSTGGAITLSKFVREEIYVWRVYRHTSRLVLLIRSLALLPFLVLRKLLGRQVFEGDPNLSNHLYVIYRSVKDTVNPVELGYSGCDLKILNPDDVEIRYISRFKPDIIYSILKLKSGIKGNF